MGKNPAAHHDDISIADADGARGSAAPVVRDVRVNGRAMLRFGDKGLYPQCAKGSNVPWWACEGYSMVMVNGFEASGATLATGSINGLGVVEGTSSNVFIGGPRVGKLERARKAALARIRRAQDALLRWNPADRARFKKWFGDDSDAARFAMLMNVDRMHAKLEGADIVMGTDANFWAEVHPLLGPNTIEVDQFFWHASEDDGGDDLKNTESGVLIHESSHFYDTAGTDDYAYGPDKCEALARDSPRDAQHNADNIEYFCEDTP